MSTPHPTGAAQQGVTLLLTLVMLMIIGMGSAVLMQSALNTDRAALAARAHQQAQQAAEWVLRHCEHEIVQPDSPLTVQTPPAHGQHWQRWASWQGLQALAADIPATGLSTPPQCLAEQGRLPDGTPVILLTARGFSPDHRADAQGHTLAGAVAWQQVVLRLESSWPERSADDGYAQDPADAADGAFIQVGEGVQGQLLHPPVEDPAGSHHAPCHALTSMPADSHPPGGVPSAGSVCVPVVLDRLWRPLLNPPRPGGAA